MQALDYVPLGGQHLTEDLACGLKISLKEAEQLKVTHGSCLRNVFIMPFIKNL